MSPEPTARLRPARPLDLDPMRVTSSHRKPYGIVDIGSNSVRMVIYDQLGRAPLPRFNEKSLCRLGEGLAQSGSILAEGFERTISAMRRFRAIAEAMGVEQLDVTATEAIRRASNGPALVEAIAAASGLRVRVLSGQEEARYAALGVISGFFRPIGTVGDMGGGSLELTEALDDVAGNASVSVPLGALPVEALLTEGALEAKRQIDAMLQDHLPSIPAHPTFYAVGGGWRSLAKAHMAAVDAPVRVVHAYTLPAAEARAFAKSLLRVPAAKLIGMRGVATRRARTLPAAALLLDRLLKRLGPERVVFSALGLREGLLYSQLSETERYLDPLVEGAQLVGLPVSRAPEFAPAIARWTEQLFPDETPAEARLRIAVCAMSDFVWRDPPELRADESFRRLLQFPFIGIDHAERVFLAASIQARYAGNGELEWPSSTIAMLPPETRRRALILGRAIKLAYRLAGGSAAILQDARLKLERDSLWLEVPSAARAPDSEVVADRLSALGESLGVRRSGIRNRGA